MAKIRLLLMLLFCSIVSHSGNGQITGSEFVEIVSEFPPDERDNLFTRLLINGALPEFMQDFVRIDVLLKDYNIKASYFVMPDYLCIGTNSDFIRMPIQPKYAQQLADYFGCFLATKKISDDIFNKADVKLEPIPMEKDREDLATFIEHNILIEKQRNGKRGLIAGHKKDVILTKKISENTHPNRVALYGWHKLDGMVIQPIYTGHTDKYVDYSHGFRLVIQYIFIEGKPMHFIEVMKHPVYRNIISDEADCQYFRYPTESDGK